MSAAILYTKNMWKTERLEASIGLNNLSQSARKGLKMHRRKSTWNTISPC
ncbi:MAG: hypothetical protein BWY68_00135 [bacterium ADurb.Bin400]|nr:MAG: hypothetical protein BWY68_00135 [bacterium ADurb.Bin400]